MSKKFCEYSILLGSFFIWIQITDYFPLIYRIIGFFVIVLLSGVVAELFLKNFIKTDFDSLREISFDDVQKLLEEKDITFSGNNPDGTYFFLDKISFKKVFEAERDNYLFALDKKGLLQWRTYEDWTQEKKSLNEISYLYCFVFLLILTSIINLLLIYL